MHLARWRRFMAFIKATKRRHQVRTRSDITQSNTPTSVVLDISSWKRAPLDMLVPNNIRSRTYLYFVGVVNSLTPKPTLVGMKISCLEGCWQAKHKHTNIPTMMEPISPPGAWFWWMKILHPGSLFAWGWTRLPSKGSIIINKIKENIIYFYTPSL